MINRLIIFFILAFTAAVYTSCQDAKYAHGKRTYIAYCGDCHMDDGSGVADLYPSLNNQSVTDKYKDIPCIIRNGIYDETSLIKMPSHPKMSNVDIANIINYITHDINKSDISELELPEVDALLEQCQPSTK